MAKRTRKLEPKAREMIKTRLYDAGEIETEAVMDMIRPHYLFDPDAAKEREIRRAAQQMMSGMRDEKGIRTTFNCKVDGVSMYVDIDASKNPTAIRSVEGQLKTKLEGLQASKSKASRRRMEVEGQMSLDLTGTDHEEG
ncbi:MAG: hypothetical protein ACRDBO_06110 [Lachnospiraceae bacterium]